MSENQQLMQEAKDLNLTYDQVYAGIEQVFPVGDKPYIGSLANHFRGKLKTYGTVDGLIECMCNNSLRRLIAHFSPVFTCQSCGHELPESYSLRTAGFCYLCDPNITIAELLAPAPLGQ